MVDGWQHLTHLFVVERSSNQDFRRRGSGNPKVRRVEDRIRHGSKLREELIASFEIAETKRQDLAVEDELRAIGSIITLTGADAAFPIKLESLQQNTRHRISRSKWILLSVAPGNDNEEEQAAVWVNDEYRAEFLKIFEDYLENNSRGGKPRNESLVANIASIRTTLLRDLWQMAADPPVIGVNWWEIWLRVTEDNVELIRSYADKMELNTTDRVLNLGDRTVVWVQATWQQLEGLPLTSVPIAEIRRPSFIESIHELTSPEQDEYIEDLASRVVHANLDSPTVVHLDTGVARTHMLLKDSLNSSDLHTVIGTSGFDTRGHGTKMAGLALYGNLHAHLLSSDQIILRHRLESVRFLPNDDEPLPHPITYGDITIEAVNAPEAVRIGPRVFCMPVNADIEPERPGEPTLWSASLDALAVGVDVVRRQNQLSAIGIPNPNASRLIVVSAGNVPVEKLTVDHLDESDTSPIQDPAQAWNVLTVGAYTELVEAPKLPEYKDWSTVAPVGELSPHSRTSLLFSSTHWPIKPDVLMEGGNTLTDGQITESYIPGLTLSTTSNLHENAVGLANATSAATAQVSRLAAMAMATYPSYWPETIRGLIVHAAEWSPKMKKQIDEASGKHQKLLLLRRYGWGVPTEESVLTSSQTSVKLVSQDQFIPFVGPDYSMPAFRLHELPWPSEVLESIDDEDVTLKVTLSYFIEPSAARRGWRQKFSYASHMLRFDLQRPLESTLKFIDRINQEIENENGGSSSSSSDSLPWVIGPQQRNVGSLHQDILVMSGQDLSRCRAIAIYPVGGWWKKSKSKTRLNQTIRYSLIISLTTDSEDVDLYTPIANILDLPVPIEISII